MAASLMWAVIPEGSMHGLSSDLMPGADFRWKARGLRSVLGNWRIGRNRPGIRHRRRRVCFNRPERAVIIQEFVEHPLDRGLGFIRTGVAHVVVLERGAHDGNA